MTFANSLTTFFSSENIVFILSMIESASMIASISMIVSIIDIAIFSAIETKNFKYIVSMSFSKINEISYFQDQNVLNFLNRFDFMCENYEFFEIDRIKRLS